MVLKKNINRRKFLGSAAGAFAFTIVPRNVLGGPKYVPPSDKVTLACVGCGTQGLRTLTGVLANPEIQIVATCDPERDNTNYIDWSTTGIRNRIRKAIQEPSWGEGVKGIRGGRDVAKEVVEKYYALERSSEVYNGCNAYADFREMLDKEKDLNGVHVITPDHQHATIAIAAMKSGKNVVMHKPIANRVYEGRKVMETCRATGAATHNLATGRTIGEAGNLIRNGAIGTLKEVHNWTDRPFWPHWAQLFTERPRVPRSFRWDLWLGPVPDRPYHPLYTHNVYRGWYDFGGGCIADMGNYSLSPIFVGLDLGIPTSVEAIMNSDVSIINQVSRVFVNDVAWPKACSVKFKVPMGRKRTLIDLYWYDGGLRPLTNDDVASSNGEMTATGTMFIGDKGTILNGEIYPENRRREYMEEGREPAEEEERRRGSSAWLEAFKGGEPSPGNFLNEEAVTETICLALVAVRYSRKVFRANVTTPPLQWDAKSMKVTNIPEANEYIYREYRPGWEL